jgi:hypothetical protein
MAHKDSDFGKPENVAEYNDPDTLKNLFVKLLHKNYKNTFN